MRMLYIDLPTGGRHGWGVVGDNLASALAELTATTRLGDDSLEHAPHVAGPLLQSITRPHLRPRRSPSGYTRHVGYSVFEFDLIARRAAAAARGTYDVLVAASHWAEQALREGGLSNVTTIHHGVDVNRFHGAVATAERSLDDFVIFSGGKFELRKGQDIVVHAFRIFADRHADARLVVAWHNPWASRGSTMAASPYHPFTQSWDGASPDALLQWIAAAGVDPARVTVVPPLPNDALAAVYASTDIGLFPNRCEGSTNLVMMEYMACGRPVVATHFSGHCDVITDANSVPLRRWRIAPFVERGEAIACWCEADIDETVEALERAYQSRDQVSTLGRQAAADMREWTWERAAAAFVRQILPDAAQVADSGRCGQVGA